MVSLMFKNVFMSSVTLLLGVTLVFATNDVEVINSKIIKEGTFGSKSYRINYKGGEDGESIISPWHDIPLKNDNGDGNYNMVVEIPKMTTAKMEIATKEKNNPIAQDLTKKGTIRDYHGPIFWNYGCIPQTWEDPNVLHPQLNIIGDNDPIDLVEIGSAVLGMGSVKEVKVLGALAMIDDGELDWKVIVLATDDPLADQYNDIDDVPDVVKSGIREWFRWYKTPDNKALNRFGFDEKYITRQEAIDVIEETHVAWKKLKAGMTSPDKLWVGETTDSFASDL
uniref:inorganic diphosphatase n=1 Tax=Eucampia antarctica TaxID=49252 RepID=A0A7S2QZZ6_9STRA|mmetsp:Transcript_11287/g.10799  ORF Transcript_11287/g.10799 Transcript_11287/m.10799 type:complete len:281 (+) Transcript_11287:88-930(+)